MFPCRTQRSSCSLMRRMATARTWSGLDKMGSLCCPWDVSVHRDCGRCNTPGLKHQAKTIKRQWFSFLYFQNIYTILFQFAVLPSKQFLFWFSNRTHWSLQAEHDGKIPKLYSRKFFKKSIWYNKMKFRYFFMNFFQDWPTNMSHQGLLPTKPSHWPQHPNTAAVEARRGLGNTKGGNWRDGNFGTIEMISFSWYFFSGYKSETRSFWLLVLETLEGTWSHCKRTEKFWWGE